MILLSSMNPCLYNPSSRDQRDSSIIDSTLAMKAEASPRNKFGSSQYNRTTQNLSIQRVPNASRPISLRNLPHRVSRAAAG